MNGDFICEVGREFFVFFCVNEVLDVVDSDLGGYFIVVVFFYFIGDDEELMIVVDFVIVFVVFLCYIDVGYF